jgi:predicted GNAT family acetyltransferase
VKEESEQESEEPIEQAINAERKKEAEAPRYPEKKEKLTCNHPYV